MGAVAKIRVVGSAAVAMQVGREALTEDIDALYGSSPQVKAAVENIAQARNWPPTWLNDAVKMYVSHYITDEDWDLRIEEEEVMVFAARNELLLAMKLKSGRGRRDQGDLDRLFEACRITSVADAEGIFDRYYPQDVIAAPARRQLEARFPAS